MPAPKASLPWPGTAGAALSQTTLGPTLTRRDHTVAPACRASPEAAEAPRTQRSVSGPRRTPPLPPLRARAQRRLVARTSRRSFTFEETAEGCTSDRPRLGPRVPTLRVPGTASRGLSRPDGTWSHLTALLTPHEHWGVAPASLPRCPAPWPLVPRGPSCARLPPHQTPRRTRLWTLLPSARGPRPPAPAPHRPCGTAGNRGVRAAATSPGCANRPCPCLGCAQLSAVHTRLGFRPSASTTVRLGRGLGRHPATPSGLPACTLRCWLSAA